MFKYAFKHDPMHPRDWCWKIANDPTFLGQHAKLRFARILNYSTIAGPLFVFAEHTEPVVFDAIKHLSEHMDLDVGMISPKTATVTIKDLMNPDPTPPGLPSIIMSNTLSFQNSMVVVQYDNSHTISIPKRIFYAIIDHYPHFTGSLSAVTIVRPSESALAQKTIEDLNKHVISRIEFLEEAHKSYAESEKLQRLTNRAKYENVSNLLKKHSDDLADIHQRVGPLHESVVRLRLEATRGSEWGKSKTIFGLYDMFGFVAAGLNAIPAQRKKAMANLYTRLIIGFQNWNYNPKGLKLSDIDFNVVTPFSIALF